MNNFTIIIDGVPLPEIMGDVIEITVDTDCFMPSMFTITLLDTTSELGLLEYTDDLVLFAIGALVEINVEVTSPETDIPEVNSLIIGQIASVEPIFRDDGQVHLRVRGYDRAHPMTLGKKTRTWGLGIAPTVTEEEIVSEIAASHGLVPEIDMTELADVEYESIIQYNQSDWDFLWARARLLGYQLYVDEGLTLRFVGAEIPRSLVPVELTWTEDLISFKPRFVASGAVIAAEAHAYDPDLKVGTGIPNVPEIGELDLRTSPTVAKEPTGSSAIVIGFESTAMDHVTYPVIHNPLIAETIASARFLEHESNYVQASGVAMGNPNLLAGCMATVLNVGERFAGDYYITKATHIYRGGQYTVEFEVSGRNPFTLAHMTGQDPEFPKISGAVVAIVTDILDPEELGRIKVRYPWMPQYDFIDPMSGFARMAIQGGGRFSGIYFSPEINDEVLVVFENGDINFPYIVGVLWNDLDRPPMAPPGQAVLEGIVGQRMIVSRSGHKIILDDTLGEEKIIIRDEEMNGIEIDTVEGSMTIRCIGDLTIECGGILSIKSGAEVTVESGAEVSIESAGPISLMTEAEASIEAGASGLTLTAASATLEAPDISLAGEASVSLEGATVEITGGLVSIN